MTKFRNLALASVITIAICAPTPVSAQGALAGVTGAVAADVLRTQIDNLIASAQQDANLVVFNAATEARDALDAWQRANSALIDQAFSKLDAQQRQLFMNIQAAIDKVNAAGEERTAQAQQLADTALLVVNSLPFNKKAFVTRYTPRTIFPGGSQPTVFRIFGPNMDKASPSVTSGEQPLDLIDNTSNSASFILPDEMVVNEDGTVKPIRLEVRYKASPSAWFGKDWTTKPLTPWVLPATLGTYVVTPVVKNEVFERKVENFYSGRLSGKNKNVFKGVHPPDGWRFDLERFSSATVRGDGGEAGRCQNIADNDRSENGVQIQGRVDQIRKVSLSGVHYKDGWIKCIAALPIYRIVEREKVGAAQSGTLDWYKDVRITAPAGLKRWDIAVQTFDGRSRSFQGSATDKYFGLEADSTGVTFSPTRPKEY